jgi:hypothetical protein
VASFADLSPYSYLPETVPPGAAVRNVGWLGPDSVFPRGASAKEFTDALLELCTRHASARTRGWHSCELEHEEGQIPYPFMVRAGAEPVPLGGAEVRVLSEDGGWLAAPDLVYHYVVDHDYLPPREFVAGVLEGRVAP